LNEELEKFVITSELLQIVTRQIHFAIKHYKTSDYKIWRLASEIKIKPLNQQVTGSSPVGCTQIASKQFVFSLPKPSANPSIIQYIFFI
jgi:hypothetical protein